MKDVVRKAMAADKYLEPDRVYVGHVDEFHRTLPAIPYSTAKNFDIKPDVILVLKHGWTIGVEFKGLAMALKEHGDNLAGFILRNQVGEHEMLGGSVILDPGVTTSPFVTDGSIHQP